MPNKPVQLQPTPTYVDGDTLVGDGSLTNPVRATGAASPTVSDLTVLDLLTLRQLQFSDENRVNLPAGLTTSWDPGSSAVIAAVAAPPYALVDSLAPVTVENRVRILKNVGNAPIVFMQGFRSGGPGQEHFQLPSVSCIPNSSRPAIAYPNDILVFMQGDITDNFEWRVLQPMSQFPRESITPVAMPAGNVDDYAPVDATSGLPGQFAGTWRITPVFGTQLRSINIEPAGLPPFVHGDRLQLINYGNDCLLMHLAVPPPGVIRCPPGGANNPNYTLLNGATVWLIYDGFNTTWVVEGARV